MKDFKAYYQIEFDLIPRMAASYKRGGHKLLILNEKGAWKGMLNKVLPAVANGFDWDEWKIITYGKETDSTIVILYIFPKPFRMPLAKYGAVIINNSDVTYYTLELSLEDYVLGSIEEGGMHFNFGNTPDLSADEFLSNVCSREKIVLPEMQKKETKESFWSKIKKLF